jgi:transcriptional/translational regulatory protein YebC/TACO1
MSGHNRWSKIKRYKESQGAAKGKPLAKGGGNLAAEGAVAWSFERRGVLHVAAGPGEDAVFEAAIEAGAEDVVNLGADGFEVRTHPNDLHGVRAALEGRKLAIGGARIAYLPKDPVKVEDPDRARALLKLVALLEDLEDVQNVHAGFEIDDELVAQIA